MAKFGKKEKMMLLVVPLLFVSIFITGCDNKEYSNTKGTEMLSKEQVLKIANRAARDLHFSPSESEILYDVERAKWQENLRLMEKLAPGWSKEFETLNDRDYVIVLYRPKEAYVLGGVLWLFIDKKTGEIITYSPEI